MRNTPHRVEVWGQVRTGTNAYGSPVYEFQLRTSAAGWFAVLAAEEREGQAQEVEASARVPHGLDVAFTDEVRVTGHPGIGEARFEVAAIRPNVDHLRLMLSRYTP